MNYTQPTPQSSVPSTEQVHEVLQAHPGERLTAPQIVSLLPSSDLSLKQVQNALGMLIRNDGLYRNVHRVGRGEYVYDESRVRRRIVKRKAVVKSTPEAKPVVETKRSSERAVIPSGALHPVQDATVMQDNNGNLYIVRATKV